MKKSPVMLALLVFSAPLLFKNKISAAQPTQKSVESQGQSKLSQVSGLIKEYLTCGTDCPKKYKDALVAQIAKIRNISKKQAAALVVLAFLTYKGYKQYTAKKPLGLPESAFKKAAEPR